MQKSEITMNRILEAAVLVIHEKGYNAAKTLEIAERAEVSEATLFKYFKSKRGLLHGIANFAAKTFGQTAIYKPLNAILETNLDAPFGHVIDLIIEDRLQFIQMQYPLINLIFNEAQYDEAFRDIIVVEIFTPLSESFGRFYKHQVELGHVKAVKSTTIVFRMLVISLLTPIFQRVLMRQPVDIDVLKGEFLVVKQIILNGVTQNETAIV